MPLRNRQQTLRAHACGQYLHELGVGLIIEPVDGDEMAALETDKEEGALTKTSDGDPLRLDASVLRTIIRVMAVPYGLLFEGSAGLKKRHTGLREHREIASAAEFAILEI